MEAVFLAYSEGGCSLPQAALTSSFLRIQVHPVPHLPPQAAAVKKKKRLRVTAEGVGQRGMEGDVQPLHRSDTIPVIASSFFPPFFSLCAAAPTATAAERKRTCISSKKENPGSPG